MNTNLKLRAVRVGFGMNQKDMCKLLGFKGESSYSLRENGKRKFSQAEIEVIANRFNLSGEQIKDIFFNSQHTSKDNFSCVEKEMTACTP